MGKIEITCQLTFKEYLKANYELIYRKGSVIIFTIVGLLMIFLFIHSLKKIVGEGEFVEISPIIIACILLIVYPISIYFTSRKNYTTTRRIGETVNCVIDAENIVIKGESFESTSSWDKIYQVSATRDCILIWESIATAHIIPKRYFSPEQLDMLKVIIVKHPSIKNKLK